MPVVTKILDTGSVQFKDDWRYWRDLDGLRVVYAPDFANIYMDAMEPFCRERYLRVHRDGRCEVFNYYHGGFERNLHLSLNGEISFAPGHPNNARVPVTIELRRLMWLLDRGRVAALPSYQVEALNYSRATIVQRLKTLAAEFNVEVRFDSPECAPNRGMYSEGVIRLGEFPDPELMVVAFFRGLAEHRIPELLPHRDRAMCKVSEEGLYWEYAKALAREHGYVWDPDSKEMGYARLELHQYGKHAMFNPVSGW